MYATSSLNAKNHGTGVSVPGSDTFLSSGMGGKSMNDPSMRGFLDTNEFNSEEPIDEGSKKKKVNHGPKTRETSDLGFYNYTAEESTKCRAICLQNLWAYRLARVEKGSIISLCIVTIIDNYFRVQWVRRLCAMLVDYGGRSRCVKTRQKRRAR